MGYFFWIWLILILILSSIPNLPVHPKTIIPHVRSDYLIHFIQYFILAALFVFWRQETYIQIYKIILLLIAGFLFASADELHQLIIPGRSLNIKDVISDMLGFFFGFMSATWWLLISQNKNC